MEHWPVEVRGRDLIVTMPSKGQSVTYRKQGYAPILEALDTMRENLDAERLAFLVQAWKAAYYKAKELGWLESQSDDGGAARRLAINS
jgi:hypothetical protein